MRHWQPVLFTYKIPLTTRRSGRGGRPRLPGVQVGLGSKGCKRSHCASVTSVSYWQAALIVHTPPVIVCVGKSGTTWVPPSQDTGVTSARILKQLLTGGIALSRDIGPYLTLSAGYVRT